MNYEEHIARAVEYIEKNLTNEIGLNACAKACDYQKYYFLRVFKDEPAMTPADYLSITYGEARGKQGDGSFAC